MGDWMYKFYHNPRCSKSRECLAFLEEKGMDFSIVEYLKTPPTEADLRELCQKLKLPLQAFVRTQESVYQDLGLSQKNEAQLLRAVLENPILLERPILVGPEAAVIGRPTQKIKDFLEKK